MALPALSAIVSAAAALTADLTSSTKALAGVVAIAGTLTADGEMGLPRALAGTVPAVATLNANGNLAPQLSGKVVATSALSAQFTAIPALRGRVTSFATLRANPMVDGQGLTVQEVVQVVLTLWGQGCCGTVGIDSCLYDEAIRYINAALQSIFSQAHRLDYFNRVPLTLTITSGTDNKAFPQNVQLLLGPVRLKASRQPLTHVPSRSEFENFVDYYYAGVPPTVPRAYHLESLNQAQGDNVALTLLVAPAPAADTDVLVDVSTEPPRFSPADIHIGTPIEIPHRYAELLLLPLVRKWATSHRLFTRKELQPQIDAQFEIAQTSLGLITPDPKPTAKAP